MDSKSILITTISLSFIILAVHFSNAYAVDTLKYPLIMILPSETCQKIIQNHAKSDCPTDDLLMKYDTSNQYISGHFVKINGTTIREKPLVKNHYIWYNGTGKITVCVDCEGDYFNPDLFQTIIIEPHGFTFIDKYANATNNKWNSNSDRNMQGCSTATIAYSDSLLNDTIQYLKSGCTKTSFNGTKTYLIPDQPWQWNNPYSTLHQITYLKSILHNHTYNNNMTSGGTGPSLCINGKTCNFVDPYQKVGYR